MRNYYGSDIRRFFETQQHLAQFYLVAHTNIRPATLSKKVLELRLDRARADLRYALNLFAGALHPQHSNLVRRKPHIYRPLTLTTIEATDTAQVQTLTTHFNIVLGNIPQQYRRAETLTELFRQAWRKAGQADDIHIQPITNSIGLNYYILKEAELAKQKAFNDTSTWDVENTFIPRAAAYAD